MENINEKRAALINELIAINNDRIEGYGKAINILDKSDFDLQGLFEKYRDQSIQFNNELIPLVVREGSSPTEETKTSGKLFRAWMEIKSSIMPHSIKPLLESCERGEEECKKVYVTVLEKSRQIALDLTPYIESQAIALMQAHHQIKELRDSVA